MHYQRVASTGTTDAPRLNGVCVITGCGHKEVAHSWLCPTHRHRLRAYGSTDPRPRMTMQAICRVLGCKRQARGGRGWCRTHYIRWRKHGGPTTTLAGELLRQENATGRRVCTQCKKSKTLDNYRENSKYLNGRLRTCDTCIRGNAKEKYPTYRIRHQRQGRERRLLRKYGLTIAAYEARVAEQHGQCAICHVGVVELHVDHDHATGAVRGLLCLGCNLALGYVQDSLDVLQSLMTYLRAHGK